MAAAFCFAACAQTPDWTTTWATALQIAEPHNNPPAPGLADNSFRQTVQVSIGGKALRLHLSNLFNEDETEILGVEIDSRRGDRPRRDDGREPRDRGRLHGGADLRRRARLHDGARGGGRLRPGGLRAGSAREPRHHHPLRQDFRDAPDQPPGLPHHVLHCRRQHDGLLRARGEDGPLVHHQRHRRDAAAPQRRHRRARRLHHGRPRHDHQRPGPLDRPVVPLAARRPQDARPRGAQLRPRRQLHPAGRQRPHSPEPLCARPLQPLRRQVHHPLRGNERPRRQPGRREDGRGHQGRLARRHPGRA